MNDKDELGHIPCTQDAASSSTDAGTGRCATHDSQA
jgi:hypothetical protein